MSLSRQKHLIIKTFLFFAFIAIDTIFFKAVFTLREQLFVFQAPRWPSVEGEVTLSEVKEALFFEDGILYYPEVHYNYIVNGQAFEGKRISFLSIGDFFGIKRSYWVVKEKIKAYTPQEKTLVFYHPSNPKVSVLETKIDFDWAAVVICFEIFFCIFLLSWGVHIFFILKRMETERLVSQSQ